MIMTGMCRKKASLCEALHSERVPGLRGRGLRMCTNKIFHFRWIFNRAKSYPCICSFRLVLQYISHLQQRSQGRWGKSLIHPITSYSQVCAWVQIPASIIRGYRPIQKHYFTPNYDKFLLFFWFYMPRFVWQQDLFPHTHIITVSKY